MTAIAKKNTVGPRVVVLGGGNGTSHILRALLPALREGRIASLHALVHMADDGGSTGRLREQYAVGAMGDLTRCLLAISRLRGDVRGEKFIRALEHRFDEGDFKGHTLRNALLAAMEITSDLDAAIATFARILQIPKYSGVIPTTLKPLTQVVSVQSEKGPITLGKGQHFISWNVDLQQHPEWKPEDIRVTFAEHDVKINPRAKRVLKAATHIIIAPGHTYGSILPTLASLTIDDSFSIADLNVRFIAVMTLLTTPLHTVGWSGEDFVHVYESYIGRPLDVVIANTGTVAIELVEGQEWVKFSKGKHPYCLVAENVVITENQSKVKGDDVPRAIVVHDTEKIQAVLEGILV